MADLSGLIDAFAAARVAYHASPEGETTEWEAYCKTEYDIVAHPCRSLEDVRQKARFFLDNGAPNDTLRHDRNNAGPALDQFLRSLLSEAQP
jgi:hypothetical protein